MLRAFYNLLLSEISWILEVTKKAQGKINIKKNIVERNLLIPALINLGLKIIHFTCTGFMLLYSATENDTTKSLRTTDLNRWNSRNS